MRLVLSLAASALLLGLAQLPARATSCGEQIGTIERRLDSAGAVHVAGLQDGHTIRSSNSPKALSEAPAGEPSDASMIATAAHMSDLAGCSAAQSRRTVKVINGRVRTR